MVAGVYLITNKINDHKYVGGSVNIQERFRQHKNYNDVENSAIDKAIKKYGADNFTYQIITELPADWNIIGEHEKYWIKFYNTFHDKKHYNLTNGGECFEFSQETKDKISKSRKGKYCGEKNHNYGKHLPKEVRNKISKSRKGRFVKEQNAFYNKHHSISQKESWSKSRSINQNTTGFYHVTKQKNNRLLQGFNWLYQYYDGNKRKKIGSVDIFELKKKIESKGLPWKIVNIENAIRTMQEDVIYG